MIKHVEKCFTKKSMKENRVKMEGEKKRKRSPKKSEGKDTLNTSNIRYYGSRYVQILLKETVSEFSHDQSLYGGLHAKMAMPDSHR